jgi:toxin ParE1/3/4
MRAIRVAAVAEEDLKAIWDYVAQHNPETASKLIREIISKFALLRGYPHVGRQQHKMLVNLRSLVVKDYIIFYQPSEDGVEILRVMHGSRDVNSIFENFLDSL